MSALSAFATPRRHYAELYAPTVRQGKCRAGIPEHRCLASGTARANAGSRSRLAQQFQQLRNIRRNPPRLIATE
jgi:hypothetical protein